MMIIMNGSCFLQFVVGWLCLLILLVICFDPFESDCTSNSVTNVFLLISTKGLKVLANITARVSIFTCCNDRSCLEQCGSNYAANYSHGCLYTIHVYQSHKNQQLKCHENTSGSCHRRHMSKVMST